MIGENEDCVKKSNLQQQEDIRYIDRSRVVAKQKNKWNRLRDTETGEHLEKKLKIKTQADLESTYAHSEVNTKLNMRSYVLLLLKQKILNRKINKQ